MASQQIPEHVEFTHPWYRRFLDFLRQELGEFRTFSSDVPEEGILLRHDIDLSVERALKMARIEAEKDIQSTYCVHLSSPLYNPFDRTTAAQIRAIANLGHDIGLHFDTHNFWDETREPDAATLESMAVRELVMLETIADTRADVVSFHRPPEWVLDREFEPFVNTYSPPYFSEMAYRADSSQRWREEPPDLRNETVAQVLTHPGLWGERDESFERRVERSIISACRRTNRRAVEEYIGDDRGSRRHVSSTGPGQVGDATGETEPSTKQRDSG